MTQSYESLGANLNITAQGSTNVINAQSAVTIVGGYDSANATAGVSAGEVYGVQTVADAIRLFGENSELAKEVELAISNGIETVYAAPVAETTGETESFADSQSGTLANTPFDPSLHTDHTVEVQDTTEGTELSVTASYTSPPPTPSTENTVAINYQTGEWATDTASSYDFTYDFGAYESAIKAAVDTPAAVIAVCTEQDIHKTVLQTELTEHAANFDFKRGIVGAKPHIETADVDSYQPTTDDWRVVEVAPSRGYREGYELRTVGALAAMIARQPINANGSITYERVQGLSDLGEAYLPTTTKGFSAVTAITRQYEVAEGVTTSSDPAFSDIFHVTIIENVASTLFEITKQYRGVGDFQENRANLATDIRRALYSFANATPPLLATGEGGTPYTINVTTGANDQSVNVNVGMEIVDIMKQVNLNLNVGEIVEFEGASSEESSSDSDSASGDGSGDDSSGDGETAMSISG